MTKHDNLIDTPFLLCFSGKTQTEKEGSSTTSKTAAAATSGEIVNDDSSFLAKLKKKIFG